MFETITLFENRAVSATWREIAKGKYEVKLKATSRKVEASGLGKEKDVALADWVDIGVLDAKDKPIAIERRRLDRKEQEYTLVVDKQPAKAGIDPLNKLIDRKPSDNVVNATKL